MTEIVLSPFCPNCRSIVVDEPTPGVWRAYGFAVVKFCPECGHKLGEAVGESELTLTRDFGWLPHVDLSGDPGG